MWLSTSTHLRRHKLGSAKEHLKLCVWIVLTGEAEINDLDAITRLGEAENVLGLQVQMNLFGNKSD